MGKPKPYVITTEEMWAVHDLMPDHFKVAVLPGAFLGLRVAEVSGLRVADVDFLRGVVHPEQQWPGVDLKTEGSKDPVPIPPDLTLLLAASVEKYPSDMMVTNGGATGPDHGLSSGHSGTCERRLRDCHGHSPSTICATTWRRC